jgi:hypothetical protein
MDIPLVLVLVVPLPLVVPVGGATELPVDSPPPTEPPPQPAVNSDIASMVAGKRLRAGDRNISGSLINGRLLNRFSAHSQSVVIFRHDCFVRSPRRGRRGK